MSIISDLDKVQKWSEYIWRNSGLLEIRVHPRQESFARMLATPRYWLNSNPTYTLIVSFDIPESEMHLVYEDHMDIVEIGGNYESEQGVEVR